MKKIFTVILLGVMLAQLSLGAETSESAMPTGFTVEEWVSTTLVYSHNDTLIWRKLFPGDINISADNNITLRVELETNIASDIYVKGDDFACMSPLKCGSDTFNISALTICNTSMINDTGCWPWILNTSYGPSGGYYHNVPAPSGSPISKLFTFFMTTPGAQRAGVYQANFTLKTIKQGDTP